MDETQDCGLDRRRRAADVPACRTRPTDRGTFSAVHGRLSPNGVIAGRRIAGLGSQTEKIFRNIFHGSKYEKYAMVRFMHSWPNMK